MTEYEDLKIGYTDRSGNFITIGSASDISITSSNYGSKLTVSTASYSDDPWAICRSTCYSKATHTDNYVINMFDKIKDYKVYGKTTIVFFSDGTKETVVCNDEDNFDVEQGIAMCVIKRMLGDKYKKSVRSIVKAKTLNEKNVQKLEAANKESQLKAERKEKRNRENKLRMKARYEARLLAAIEEEKNKLKEK